MTVDKQQVGSGVQSTDRRSVLRAGAYVAATSALGFPALVSAQAEKIKIGHLTPLTGFLGALGEYAVQGIKMAPYGGFLMQLQPER